MNESVPRHYDPDQLRTFLAVAQSLSFTQAAARLGLRQPTVSQQVRRLEEAVGRELFVRDTRSVALTADGDAMAGFARSILAAHEQAVAYFTGSGLVGLGVPVAPNAPRRIIACTLHQSIQRDTADRTLGDRSAARPPYARRTRHRLRAGHTKS